LIGNLLIDSLFIFLVESSYLDTDVRKLESLKKSETRNESADSSKAYSKPGAFDLRTADTFELIVHDATNV